MLYTIVSEADIFAGVDERPVRCVQSAAGVYLEGECGEQGFRIDRIISTDPKDYLDGKYRLGEYLK